MRHIFVSYCHDDADFAQILEGKIREAGFTTWRDLNLSAGDDWRVEIDDGIKDALAVILVMSPGARVSAYVNYEWAFAIGRGIPVVPLLLKLTPADLHPRLSVIQCLDFSNYLLRPWDRLVETLRDFGRNEREFTLPVPRDAPPVVREAARALDDMDSSRRLAAIASLAQMNHPAAIELLAEAVRHPVQEVRFAAAFQLGENFHDPRALPALIEALRCRDENMKLWFITRIGEAAVPALLEILKEKGFDSRRDVFVILGNIGGPTVVQALTGYLRDPEPATRSAAAFALCACADSAALPALRDIMRDPEPEVRRGAAAALGKCGGASALSELMELLRDSESSVRHEAVCSIGDICELRPVPPALEPLVPRLVDALIVAIDDRDDQVRAFGRMALKKLGDPRSIPCLIAALGQGHGHPAGISEVLEGLGQLALPALREAVHDPRERVRVTAMKLLPRIDDETGAPLVAEIMQDPDPDVRLPVVRTLGYGLRTSPVIFQALIERLHDPEEDVSIAAIETLGEIRNPAAAPHLIECLKIEALAPAAADALQWFDTREARAALKVWNKRKRE